IVIAHRRDLEASARPRDESVLPHQAHDAFATDRVPLLAEVFPHARTPVGAAAGLVRRPDEHAQLPIAPGVSGFRATLPRIEPAARDAQAPTEDRDRVAGLLRRDESKSYRSCFAKKAVAFFRI